MHYLKTAVLLCLLLHCFKTAVLLRYSTTLLQNGSPSLLIYIYIRSKYRTGGGGFYSADK
nr:MAG TPA: hypothetical protein [Caudoviricetes sp.]